MTLDFILNKVLENPDVQIYLPDEPKRHVTRQWLLDVVNSLDPVWIVKVEREIDATAKPAQRQPEVQLTKQMHSVITQFAKWNLDVKPNVRSLRLIGSHKKISRRNR